MHTVNQTYLLDKPETLEMVSLTPGISKDQHGNETSFSFLWRRWCSLSYAFNEEHYERFQSRAELEKRYDAVYNGFRTQGFKTREELGMQPIGICHDEIFFNHCKQLIVRYLKALAERLNSPPL
jgi:hypothetical protein